MYKNVFTYVYTDVYKCKYISMIYNCISIHIYHEIQYIYNMYVYCISYYICLILNRRMWLLAPPLFFARLHSPQQKKPAQA